MKSRIVVNKFSNHYSRQIIVLLTPKPPKKVRKCFPVHLYISKWQKRGHERTWWCQEIKIFNSRLHTPEQTGTCRQKYRWKACNLRFIFFKDSFCSDLFHILKSRVEKHSQKRVCKLEIGVTSVNLTRSRYNKHCLPQEDAIFSMKRSAHMQWPLLVTETA